MWVERGRLEGRGEGGGEGGRGGGQQGPTVVGSAPGCMGSLCMRGLAPLVQLQKLLSAGRARSGVVFW